MYSFIQVLENLTFFLIATKRALNARTHNLYLLPCVSAARAQRIISEKKCFKYDNLSYLFDMEKKRKTSYDIKMAKEMHKSSATI